MTRAYFSVAALRTLASFLLNFAGRTVSKIMPAAGAARRVPFVIHSCHLLDREDDVRRSKSPPSLKINTFDVSRRQRRRDIWLPATAKNGLSAEDITLVWDADGQRVVVKQHFPTDRRKTRGTSIAN